MPKRIARTVLKTVVGKTLKGHPAARVAIAVGVRLLARTKAGKKLKRILKP